MAFRAVLSYSGGTVTPAWCRSLTYTKKLCYSCTTVSGTFVFPGDPEIAAEDITKVDIYWGTRLIHSGLPDKAVISRWKRQWEVSFISRGFTSLLDNTEAYPEINTNVTLASLISRNITNSHISAESGTPQVGFIYVNEGSTVWEAVSAYATKAVNGWGYIRGANTVSITDTGAVSWDISSLTLTEDRTIMDTRGVLTDIYMKGLGDSYDYEAHNTALTALGYSRTRYIPLDRQWLNEPQLGLDARLARSGLFMKLRRYSYPGYSGEELMDTVTRGTHSGRIAALSVKSDAHGVFTTIDLI